MSAARNSAARDAIAREGPAFLERARLSAEVKAREWHPELGLFEAAALSRAIAYSPLSVEVREGLEHVETGHDVARRALLLALRGAPATACAWLHLYVGHASVLPGLRRKRRVGSFVYSHVDPWGDWRAAAVFVASLQDDALAALLALVGWLRAAADDVPVSAPVGAVRASFREHVDCARAAVHDVALFEEMLRDVMDPAFVGARAVASGLRARFLAPAAGDGRSLAEVERALLVNGCRCGRRSRCQNLCCFLCARLGCRRRRLCATCC